MTTISQLRDALLGAPQDGKSPRDGAIEVTAQMIEIAISATTGLSAPRRAEVIREIAGEMHDALESLILGQTRRLLEAQGVEIARQ